MALHGDFDDDVHGRLKPNPIHNPVGDEFVNTPDYTLGLSELNS